MIEPDVAVVVCTYDRPAALRRLIVSLCAQQASFTREVIIVDNHPASGVCEQVRPSHPDLRWIAEPRQGLSYARNSGIQAARAPIIVFVDDDMEAPPGWLEALVAPVRKSDADVAVGTVMPFKIETEGERLFEAYGAHGQENQKASFDAVWLASCRWFLPVWRAAGIGNSAIHRRAFSSDRGGLFDAALGAGTPAGSWEDLYFVYRLLRAGGRIVRVPSAAILHAHRETVGGVARQLCDYRRGEACFCLLVLLRHGDLRGLSHLCLHVPAWRTRLLLEEGGRRLRGQRLFRFGLMMREAAAYLSGPFALIVSLRRAARLRSHLPGSAAE